MKFRFEDVSDLFIRWPVGFHLIYGVLDNILSNDRMVEFQLFLENHQLPFPKVGAFISVYAQFFAGILFIVGWKMKWAGVTMMINFSVAILLVHLADTYPSTFPAIWMLTASIFLAFSKAGPISIENLIKTTNKQL